MIKLSDAIGNNLPAGFSQNQVAVRDDEYSRELDRFQYSRSTELISQVPKGVVIDELLKGMLILGIKGEKLPNEAELLIMYQTMIEEYKNLKIGELSLAFRLATTGNLDFDVETYQNFSVLYLHRLLRAFARYGMQKLGELKPKEESQWMPRTVEDDEKIDLAFECYAKLKNFEAIVFGLDVFKILHNRGLIDMNVDLVYQSTINAMNKKMYSLEGNARNDYKAQFNDDDFMEHQCRRMAVALYFDKKLNNA